jgi:hypothetical protein
MVVDTCVDDTDGDVEIGGNVGRGDDGDDAIIS